MKKILIVIAVVVTAGASIWWIFNKFGDQHQKKNTASKFVTNLKKACDVFTTGDAQKVIGDGAKQTPSQTDSTSAQSSVSSCFYTYDPGELSEIVTASVLLQSASESATKQNFNSAKPSDAVDVHGYGESAYWSPNNSQLNVLKGPYWVVISAGSGSVVNRAQDLPLKIASIVLARL